VDPSANKANARSAVAIPGGPTSVATVSRLRADRVRLGVAGLGRVGSAHARNIVNHVPEAELLLVMDKDPSVARSMADELGNVAWTADYRQLLNSAVEAVLITSPSAQHADMISAAAAAGKHIFCEKPVATSMERTLTAIAATATHGVRMQVGLMLRYESHFRAAREMVESGELGEIYRFRMNHRDMAPRALTFVQQSGGLLTDVGVHDFDLARWYVGEVREVNTCGTAHSPAFREAGDIDNALVTLRFENDAIGVIDNCRMAGYGLDLSAELVGSKRTIRFGANNPIGIEVLERGKMYKRHPTNALEAYNDAYVAEIRAFCNGVVRGDAEPYPSVNDAVAAFAICDAAILSLNERRTVRLIHRSDGPGVTYDRLD